tara:strand:+ start:577 stop:810 length:234 start_codon:yes stop_codon:yes gene_type:complete
MTQGEFDFMKNVISIGESVVDRQRMKNCSVIDWTTGDDGIIEHVHVRYEDGTDSWVEYNSVSKLLLETDPKNNFLQD